MFVTGEAGPSEPACEAHVTFATDQRGTARSLEWSTTKVPTRQEVIITLADEIRLVPLLVAIKPTLRRLCWESSLGSALSCAAPPLAFSYTYIP